MSSPEVDDWISLCERWRTLALENYEPLSESKCNEIVQETLQAIKSHKPSDGMKETDTLGRRGFTELEADQSYFRFMTRKTLKAEIKQLMDHAWSLYSDGDAYKKGHLGDNCEFFQQVLQEISPDLLIIQRVQKYPSLVQMTHALAIAFRLQTGTGYMLVYRCIESPRLQNLLKADGLSMCGTFAWETYEKWRR